MYSLKYLRRQVDDLRRRLKPVLAILHLRNLSMDFCDEFRQVAFSEGYPRSRLTLMCILIQPRIGQAGFILDTVKALNKYLRGRVDVGAYPDPREMVFTLLPWARKSPTLRPDLWERPTAAV